MFIKRFWMDIIIKPRPNYAGDVAKYLGDHITKYQAIILTFSVRYLVWSRRPSPISPIFAHSTPHSSGIRGSMWTIRHFVGSYIAILIISTHWQYIFHHIWIKMVTFQICTRYILVYSLHDHIQLGCGGGGYGIGIDIIQMHFHLYLQPH